MLAGIYKYMTLARHLDTVLVFKYQYDTILGTLTLVFMNTNMHDTEHLDTLLKSCIAGIIIVNTRSIEF